MAGRWRGEERGGERRLRGGGRAKEEEGRGEERGGEGRGGEGRGGGGSFSTSM